jgi:hypothetical protein
MKIQKKIKDTDANSTQKKNINHFCYKNHIKIDAKSKIIIKYVQENLFTNHLNGNMSINVF